MSVLKLMRRKPIIIDYLSKNVVVKSLLFNVTCDPLFFPNIHWFLWTSLRITSCRSYTIMCGPFYKIKTRTASCLSCVCGGGGGRGGAVTSLLWISIFFYFQLVCIEWVQNPWQALSLVSCLHHEKSSNGSFVLFFVLFFSILNVLFSKVPSKVCFVSGTFALKWYVLFKSCPAAMDFCAAA